MSWLSSINQQNTNTAKLRIIFCLFSGLNWIIEKARGPEGVNRIAKLAVRERKEMDSLSGEATYQNDHLSVS